jgi:hypothetical protein
MTLGRRGGVTWAAVVAIAAGACAADPGDDPKGDGAGAITTPPPGGGSSSGVVSSSGAGSSSGVTNLPPSGDDASDASTSGGDESTTPLAEASAPPPPPSCATCPLTVDYECGAGATADMTSEIKPWYRITNKGTSPQALSELTVRYWYNVDASSGTLPQQYVCDYAQVDVVGGSNTAITPDVMATFGAAPTPTASADSYMEISFSAAAGSIPAGLSAQVQNRFHKNNYSGTFTQTGDYSFNGAATGFTPSTAITLYRSGHLVWGVEPGGTAAPAGDP